MLTRNICVRALLAVATLLSFHCGSESAPKRPDILLITIDTLRADSLEPYGAPDTLTPNVALLAGEGVVYEAATTPMPLTRPAHASILTGLYPDQHGVLTNHQILPEEVVTLAEILRDNGYRTCLISDVYHQFKPSKNFWRGFDQWMFLRGQEGDPQRSGPDIPQQEIERWIPSELPAAIPMWYCVFSMRITTGV